MDLALIDAIGPFFRGDSRRVINWSKIPFSHLATSGPERASQWAEIREELRLFAGKVCALGFNAASLDDVAHLSLHSWLIPYSSTTPSAESSPISSMSPRKRCMKAKRPLPISSECRGWPATLPCRRKTSSSCATTFAVLTLHVLSWIYRLFQVRHRKAMPKFMRKTAMGVDSLFC